MDLGPEGGDAGGHVVAVGTLKEIAATRESYTGQYLRPVLERRPSSKEASGKRPAPPRLRSELLLDERGE